MRRKIIQISVNTNVVSLPSEWCKNHGLKKGDEIELREEGPELVITTEKAIEEPIYHVDISGKPGMIKRILGAIYKIGYDHVKISYNTYEEKATCEEVIEQEFIGFEIVDFDSEKKIIIAKKIAEENIDGFDNVLKRLFFLIKYIGNEAVSAFKDKNAFSQRIGSLIAKDNEVNKLSDFTRRMINKKGFSRLRRLPPLYFIAEQLEKIGDEYRDLLKYANSLSEENISDLSSVNSFFNMMYDLFYSFDLEKAENICNKRKDLSSVFLEKIKKSEDPAFYMHLRNIVEKTYDLNGAVLAYNS
ncbi:MAG: AbrB/MazE/SpoVT family DNA-binding domain-containing protein [Candidatus Woesearchaeota archaeon]